MTEDENENSKKEHISSHTNISIESFLSNDLFSCKIPMKIQEGSCSILFSNNVGGTEEPIPSFMKLNDSEGNIPCVKDCIETKEEKKLRLDSFENSNSSFSEIQDKNIPNNDGNVSIDPKLIFDERLECQTVLNTFIF